MSTAVHSSSLGAIQKAWAEHIELEHRRGTPEPHPYVYASSRRRCQRRMVLECTQPDMFPEFDTDTKARLARGNQRERDIAIDLMRVGRLCQPPFDFIGQQERVNITDRRNRKVISGKIDGFIKWESGERWPAEIKSWSPFLTDRIFAFEDLFHQYWTWSGAFQLLSYLFEKNAPHGLLILDRPGLPRLIQVDLEDNLEEMEAFLADATAVVDHIEADTLPGFIQDASECKRCPAYGSLCNPPSFNEGARVIVDEEWIQKVERYADLIDTGDEYVALGAEIKKKFRGVDMAIVGNVLLEGHWQRDTKHNLPAEVKAQIKALMEPYAEKVEKGKFFLGVAKL